MTKKTNHRIKAKTFLYNSMISFCWYVTLPWRSDASKFSKLHEFTMLTPKNDVLHANFYILKMNELEELKILKFIQPIFYHVIIIIMNGKKQVYNWELLLFYDIYLTDFLLIFTKKQRSRNLLEVSRCLYTWKRELWKIKIMD